MELGVRADEWWPTDDKLAKMAPVKFQGSTNAEIASELNCTDRTIARKLERIRRIWIEAGLHDGEH